MYFFVFMIAVAHHNLYKHPLPKEHKFPMEKYELLHEQLIYEAIITENQFITPQPILEKVVLLTHTKEYLNKLKQLALSPKEERAIGFVQTRELITRELLIMQGTIDAALYALKFGCALNIAGGTHHAFASAGAGFCLLNDMAIAANYLLQQNLAKQILIIDLDVHQGNGTASIMANNKQVFTCSMHGANNYPFQKEKSDCDIALPDGTDDAAYIEALQNVLANFETKNFDFVFYLSGVDVLATDKFGKFKLSMQACAHRDELVFAFCHKNNLPVAVAMGGGYSQAKIVVDAHTNTFRKAVKFWG